MYVCTLDNLIIVLVSVMLAFDIILKREGMVFQTCSQSKFCIWECVQNITYSFLDVCNMQHKGIPSEM